MGRDDTVGDVLSEGAEGGFFKVRIRAVVIAGFTGAVRTALAARDLDLVEGDAGADVAVT